MARLTGPVKLRDGATVVDIDRYAPFLLNAVGSAWVRKTSALYRARFGLGIIEWRVISMLNIEPDITANRICEVLRLDKGAVSRALSALADNGYVVFEASPTDARKRRWTLSPKGVQTHDGILAIALACEKEMVDGVPPDELETFLSVMRRMLSNLEGRTWK